MTTEERLDQLERELARAKRRNRRMLFITVICLGGIFIWALSTDKIGQRFAYAETTSTTPVEKEVRAKRFIVEDEQGRPRALWTTTDTGEPVIVLWDEKKKARALFGLSKQGGAELSLFDNNGGKRAMLAVVGNLAAMSLFDSKYECRMLLKATDKEETSFAMLDANGKIIWMAPPGKDVSNIQPTTLPSK